MVNMTFTEFVGKYSHKVCFEGRSSGLALHQGSLQATQNTGKLKQDVLFKKLGFKETEVNQRGVV